MASERSRRGLQVWLRHRRDPTLQSGVMAVQSSGSPTGTKSGLHFGSPGNLCHLDAPPWRAAENIIGSMVVAYSRAKDVVSPSESGSPWLVPTPKECKWILTNSCWFVMQVRVI